MANVVPRLLRHYLFIYATFNYERETAKLIAAGGGVGASTLAGIRDAICMQILSEAHAEESEP